MRASRARLGRVDVEGLVQIRNRSFINYRMPNPFEGRHLDVLEAREQVWECNPGTEYLVANPVFIPRFRELCEAAISSEEGFDPHQSPFPPRQRTKEPLVASDPFLRLPSEILHSIVLYADPKEIAALRLSSHAFEQLPISIWYHLFLRKFPSVYEAWCDEVKPNHWTLLDPRDLMRRKGEQEKYEMDRWGMTGLLGDHDPESSTEWEDGDPKVPPSHDSDEFRERLKLQKETKLKAGPVKLPRWKTNWYQLYRDIAANWDKLKGLKNRERIWEDVERIAIEIKATRDKESEVGGFPTLLGPILYGIEPLLAAD